MDQDAVPQDLEASRLAMLRPAEGVVFRVLEKDFVLFSEPQQRVYQFNATAGCAWLGFSAGQPPGVIARRIADETKCSLKDAGDFLLNSLAEWETLGFLNRDKPKEHARSTFAANEAVTLFPASGHVYCFATFRIAISFPDSATTDAWNAIAGHLRQDSVRNAAIQFVVEKAECGYQILGRFGKDQSFLDPAAVAVGLKEAVLRAVLRYRSHWIALHAAVVCCRSRSVILAGSSGQGKTTLAAVLNASGAALVAEDVAFLSSRSQRLRGLPFAFAAKPGSWDILRTRFPKLGHVPEFQRPDGRTVKYLRPPRTLEWSGSPSALVFPRFSAATSLRITRMRKVTALVCLLQEAINANQWLSNEGFDALSDLIDRSVVVGLEYNDADVAAEWIRTNLLEGNPDSSPM